MTTDPLAHRARALQMNRHQRRAAAAVNGGGKPRLLGPDGQPMVSAAEVARDTALGHALHLAQLPFDILGMFPDLDTFVEAAGGGLEHEKSEVNYGIIAAVGALQVEVRQRLHDGAVQFGLIQPDLPDADDDDPPDDAANEASSPPS